MIIRILIGGLALSAAAVSAHAQDITVEHARGEASAPHNPETVVVFDLATLDNLDALGVEVDGVPGGVKPEYLSKYDGGAYEAVGTLFEPDYEAVAALQPDLILVGGRSAAKYPELAEMAPTLDLTIEPTAYLEGVRRNVEALGRIFGKEQEAAAQLEALDEKIAAAREAASGEGTALLVLTTGGRMSTHGPDGRFAVLFEEFGVTPAVEEVEAGNHGQAISHEFILEANPDWLFVIDRDAAIGSDGTPARAFLDNELVRRTTAWSEDQVVYLDPANWYLVGGGVQALGASAEQIAGAMGD